MCIKKRKTNTKHHDIVNLGAEKRSQILKFQVLSCGLELPFYNDFLVIEF